MFPSIIARFTFWSTSAFPPNHFLTKSIYYIEQQQFFRILEIISQIEVMKKRNQDIAGQEMVYPQGGRRAVAWSS